MHDKTSREISYIKLLHVTVMVKITCTALCKNLLNGKNIGTHNFDEVSYKSVNSKRKDKTRKVNFKKRDSDDFGGWCYSPRHILHEINYRNPHNPSNLYSRITRQSGEIQTVCQNVESTKKLLLFIQA